MEMRNGKLIKRIESDKETSELFNALCQIIDLIKAKSIAISERPSGLMKVGEAKIVEEYSLAAVTTDFVIPTIYYSKEECEKERLKRAEPDHWKVVSRSVVYSAWKDE